jgi:hypothetical protein
MGLPHRPWATHALYFIAARALPPSDRGIGLHHKLRIAAFFDKMRPICKNAELQPARRKVALALFKLLFLLPNYIRRSAPPGGWQVRNALKQFREVKQRLGAGREYCRRTTQHKAAP